MENMLLNHERQKFQVRKIKTIPGEVARAVEYANCISAEG